MKLFYVTMAVFLCLAPIHSFASDSSANLDISGLLQLKWLMYENMDPDNNDDDQVQSSGFAVRRARLVFDFYYPQSDLKGKIQVRFEDPVQLYDLIGIWQPRREFSLHMGQMKFPTVYEVFVSAGDLDFIERSQLARMIADYSLARTRCKSDLDNFRACNRDIGVGLKGRLDLGREHDVLQYFVMAGNGLGANLDLGGSGASGDIKSEEAGAYFWAARLDFSPIQGLVLGGHFNRNLHNDLVVDGNSYDVDRMSWSGDVRLSLPGGVRLTAMYGAGLVDDDNDGNGKTDYAYSGYEFSALWTLLDEQLTLGARYDTIQWEIEESDDLSQWRDLTFAVNVTPTKPLIIRFNYIHREFVSDLSGDGDRDDILVMLFQLNFGPYRVFREPSF